MWRAGKRRVDAAHESVCFRRRGVAVQTVPKGWQDDFRSERKRGDHRPRRERAVVGPIGHGACPVPHEAPGHAVHPARGGSRPIAGGDAPQMLTVSCESLRIPDCISLLHIRRAAAVLEIVDAVRAHERILNSAEIDPEMRQLVHEEGSTVEGLVSIQRFPLVRGGPRKIARGRQGIGGRAQAEHVEQQPFVVAFPAMRNEPTLRSGRIAEHGRGVDGEVEEQPLHALPVVQHFLLQPRDRAQPLGVDALPDPPPQRRHRVVAEVEAVVAVDPLGEEPDLDLLERELLGFFDGGHLLRLRSNCHDRISAEC